MDTMDMHAEDLAHTARPSSDEPQSPNPTIERVRRNKRQTDTELDYGEQRKKLLKRARLVQQQPGADPHAAWVLEYWEVMDAACEARNVADKILFSIPRAERDPDLLRSSGQIEAEAKASALEHRSSHLWDKIIGTKTRTPDGLALQLAFIVDAHQYSELSDNSRAQLTHIADELLDGVGAARPNDNALLALWEEIKADTKAVDATHMPDDEQFRRALKALRRKERRMSRMSPKTPAGALAMMQLLARFEEFDEPNTDRGFNHIYSGDVWTRIAAYLEEQVVAERAGSALHRFYKNLAAYEQRSAADQAPWMGLPDPDRPEPILELVRQMNDFMVLCHRSDYAEKIQKDKWSESRRDAANKLGLDGHTALLMAALSRAAQTPDGALAQVCLLEGALDITESWDDQRAKEDAYNSIKAALYSIAGALERLIGVTREDVTFHSNFLSRIHDPFNIPSFDQLPDDARALYNEQQASLPDAKSGRRRKSQMAASSAVATTRAA